MIEVRRPASKAGAMRLVRFSAWSTPALAIMASAGPAAAHPHVWPIVEVVAIFDDQGRVTAEHEKWTFDYDFSAVFKEEADTNMDGSVSDEETAQALIDNLSWIPHYDYFTFLTASGHPVAHGPPTDYTARYFAGKLYVEFTMPFAQPADTANGVGIDVYDPEFYYDFEWDYPDVDATNAPADCIVDRRMQANIDPVAAMLIRKLGLPADPTIINDPGAGYDVRVAVTCGAAAAALEAATAPPAPAPASKPASTDD